MENDNLPRLSRLTAIITLLQTKRLITSRDLADKFDVSVRTIYRDIKSLIQLGVPIHTIEGMGYQIMDGYRLPPMMFTEAEANALVTAEKIISENSDESISQEFSKSIDKIRAVMRSADRERAELLDNRLQVRGSAKKEERSIHLIKLRKAITSFLLVLIEYIDERRNRSERSIEPFAMYTTQKRWILIAYCRMRQDFRAFRLDRIMTCTVSSETFTPHDMTLQEYFEICRERYLSTPDIPLSEGLTKFDQTIKQAVMKEIKVDQFKVIGISLRTINDESALANIMGLWDRFHAENIPAQIPDKLSDHVYAVYTEYEGDLTKPYTMILGCKTDLDTTPGDGLVSVTVPSGKYLHKEETADLTQGAVMKVWQHIWQSDYPRAYHSDFEIYDAATPDPTNARFSVSIGVL